METAARRDAPVSAPAKFCVKIWSMPRPQFDEAQAKTIALEKFGIRAQAVSKLDSVRCMLLVA